MRIFISQIFISDLYIFTFIFRSEESSYFETTSCLHTFGSSSSSHTVLILSSSRFHHAIFITTLQLDIFTSSKLHLPPLSGQPSSSEHKFVGGGGRESLTWIGIECIYLLHQLVEDIHCRRLQGDYGIPSIKVDPKLKEEVNPCSLPKKLPMTDGLGLNHLARAFCPLGRPLRGLPLFPLLRGFIGARLLTAPTLNQES